MLRITLRREPYWLPILEGEAGDVAFEVEPATAEVIEAAQQQVVYDLQERPLAEGTSLARRNAAVEAALLRALGRLVIRDWRGIGDSNGNPVQPSPEYIDAILALPAIARIFKVKYLAPALVLVTEKNVSAPSPNGTSAGAPAIARPARKPARSAPTAKTSRRARKAGSPGKS